MTEGLNIAAFPAVSAGSEIIDICRLWPNFRGGGGLWSPGAGVAARGVHTVVRTREKQFARE